MKTEKKIDMDEVFRLFMIAKGEEEVKEGLKKIWDES